MKDYTSQKVINGNEELTFELIPVEGKNYIDMINQLKKRGLEFPTFSENISLLSICPGLLNDDIRNKMLLSSTASLFIPDCGVYFKDNPEIHKESICMERSELEKKLYKDPSVMFVEAGWKTEPVSFEVEEFVGHPIMKGLCEDPYKLETVAKHASFYDPKYGRRGIHHQLWISPTPEQKTIGFPCLTNKLVYSGGLFIFPFDNYGGIAYGIRSRQNID